jgi:phospholipid transport system substrate-binding protein
VTFAPARSAERLLAALLLCGVSWCALGAGPSGASHAETAEPRILDVVERLHTELLVVMKGADTLGYQGRYDKLDPVINSTFDTNFMAEKSVGRYWKKLTDEEREQLLATLGRYTVANYAGRFDAWTGQEFETLRAEDSLAGTVLVHTRLIDPGNEDVQLNYRLREVDGRWKIIDIYLNGTVSELALRRSEYSALIKREGLDALITALDQKISDLKEGDSESL